MSDLTAVWQAIDRLEDRIIKLENKPEGGARLGLPPELIPDREAIKKLLEGKRGD